MAKLLRIKDKLLLGMALGGDLFFEFVQPYSFQMKKMRGMLPPDYKLTNFTAGVSRMLRVGYLEKVVKNGEPYLRVTSRGQKSLVRDFSVFSLRRKKWDGVWRIVFYDIPEKLRGRRERLEDKLKELGFGMVQESVYISPFDVAEDTSEFLTAQGLQDFAFVGEVKRLFAGNAKLLAEGVWKLGDLNERYEDLYQKMRKGGRFHEFIAEYEDILRRDPCLPDELLPEDWTGERVHLGIKILFKKISC